MKLKIASKIAAVFLVAAIPDTLLAQEQALSTYAKCSHIVVHVTSTFEPVPDMAGGYCETGDSGTDPVWKNCTAHVNATRQDFVLDTSNERYTCRALEGDNPCAFVQAQPLVPVSATSATRTFVTNSQRVGLAQLVGQKRVIQQITEGKGEPVALYEKRRFTLVRPLVAQSSRLSCTLADGNQAIWPVPSTGNISDRIHFVGRQSDTTFEYLTFEVR